MTKIFWIILLSAVGTQCLFAQKKEAKEKICIGGEELAVFEKVGVTNFQNETSSPMIPDADYLKKKFPDIADETIADYRVKNERTVLLRCLERREGKPKKLKRSSAALTQLTFSRVGFNAAKTEALVYNGFSAPGNYCGYDFILLRKKSEIWEIIERINVIIC